MRHITFFLTVVVGLGLLLTACGSDDQQGPDLAADTTSVQAAADDDAPADLSRDVTGKTPDIIMSASDLIEDFSGKAIEQVDSTYEGKVLEVAGTLCYVDQVTYADGVTKGPVYINLCPSSRYQRDNIRCQFPEGDPQYVFGGLPDRLLIMGADTLGRGREVVIRGYYDTIGPRDFRMVDCQIVSK